MFSERAETEAREHALSCYPYESCGLIVNGKYIPCKNIAENPEVDFAIDPYDYKEATALGSIEAVVHSHVKGPDFPSFKDMDTQIKMNVPWGIIVVSHATASNIIWWGDQVPVQPLLGREFKHGIADCYALVRDWFRLKKNTLLKNFPREDAWWEMKGQNLLASQFKEAGFVQIEKPEIAGDCILAAILSKVPNHCGVYLGDGEILHHLSKRPSRIDLLDPWKKFCTHYLRYVGC